MKRRTTTFRFLGFVALADCLFAVSAGLLLLNPVRLEPASTNETEPEELASQVMSRLRAIEDELSALEKRAHGAQRAAVDVISKE